MIRGPVLGAGRPVVHALVPVPGVTQDDPVPLLADVTRGVARIDHEAAAGHQRLIVDPVVIGHDQGRVDSAESGLERPRAPPGKPRVLARRRDHGNVRVVVVERGAARLEQLDELSAGLSRMSSTFFL